MNEAKITHIFSSIQGEGLYVGQPQVFVRFAKCNLDCDFCDTVKTGGRSLAAFDILESILKINDSGVVNTVSITGGEPLLHIDFLQVLLPQLKKRSFKVYLETNGTLPLALYKIIDFVDIIAMDMKMPSSQKGRSFWTSHRDFLRIASAKEVFVKAVITPKTSADEIKKAVAIIDDIDPDIPLVLQPVTPANRVRKKVSMDKLFLFQKLANAVLKDVRIIPQVHKVLGVK